MNSKQIFFSLSMATVCCIVAYTALRDSAWFSTSRIPFANASNILFNTDNVNSNTQNVQAFLLNPLTNVYEIDGKPIVWHYWDTDEMPLYVRLLAEATQCRNPEFKVIIVHLSNIQSYLPELNEADFGDAFRSLKTVQHRPDIYRSHILYRYGGVYADVDCFALDKLYPYYRGLEDFDIITANWGGNKAALGQIGPVRANMTPIYKVAKGAKERLLELYYNGILNDTNNPKQYHLKWAEFGDIFDRVMIEEVNAKRINYRAYNGYDTVGQLVHRGLADAVMTPYHNVSKNFLPLNRVPFLFLHDSAMKTPLKTYKTIDNLFNINGTATVFSAFVGCALINCMGDMENALRKDDHATTPLAGVNVKELLSSLYDFNLTICNEIEQHAKY